MVMRCTAFLLLIFAITVSGQCPRKHMHDRGEAQPPAHSYSASPPASRPKGPIDEPELPENYIQTTFLFNDRSDDDQLFSGRVKKVFERVRKKLDTHVNLDIDNEDVDCTSGDHLRCFEYSLRDSFHLIIIEDPSKGAEMYKLSSKLNKNNGIIEASLLSAFSQHTGQDLTVYASKAAEMEGGFIRRLSNQEVLSMLAKRPKKRASIISRSPLETNLIELSLLELRSFTEKDDWGKLEEFDEKTLKTQIDSDKMSFILFWTHVNSISQHTFWLWSKASEALKEQYPDYVFGAVSCHKHTNLCEEAGIEKTDDFHTIFVYRNGERYTSMKDLRDSDYYLNWVNILSNVPAVQLKSDDELKEARRGRLKSFNGALPAITIGIFREESGIAFKVFKEVCEIFAGRYHFAYMIKKDLSTNSVFTVRRQEKKKREDFDGSFDAETLIQFVTQSSFPSIIDISQGFTSDLVLRQPREVVVLLHSKKDKISSFKAFCAKKPRQSCARIVRERCDVLKDFHEQLTLDDSKSPKLIVFIKEKIYVSEYDEMEDAETLREKLDAVKSTDPIKTIGKSDVHPLRYLQLSQVNKVFGTQPVTLIPDPHIVDTYFHHDMEGMDMNEDAYGGCPVMARVNKMQNQVRDEL